VQIYHNPVPSVRFIFVSADAYVGRYKLKVSPSCPAPRNGRNNYLPNRRNEPDTTILNLIFSDLTARFVFSSGANILFTTKEKHPVFYVMCSGVAVRGFPRDKTDEAWRSHSFLSNVKLKTRFNFTSMFTPSWHAATFSRVTFVYPSLAWPTSAATHHTVISLFNFFKRKVSSLIQLIANRWRQQ